MAPLFRDGTYRVWETETWQDLKWVAGSVVQAACWSPCGNFLAVALVGEPVVMFYRIGTQLGEISTHTLDGSCHHAGSRRLTTIVLASDEQAGIDFSPYTIKSKRGTAITVGGSIKDIAWDPTGARICVSFSNSEYIAVLNRVFETSITERSHLSLSPQYATFLVNWFAVSFFNTLWPTEDTSAGLGTDRPRF
jgi:WD40 repeat protein